MPAARRLGDAQNRDHGRSGPGHLPPLPQQPGVAGADITGATRHQEGERMTQENEQIAFAGWAILELMGHRRLAGFLAEQQIAGAGFLRLDVHDTDGAVASQFYSPASVYGITPATEEIARTLC